MSDRPILFSAPMVRALLDGRKTQTRRVVKSLAVDPRLSAELRHGATARAIAGPCPYGEPGDRLWVRETWRLGAWRDDGRVAIDYRASPEMNRTPWLTPPQTQFEKLKRESEDDCRDAVDANRGSVHEAADGRWLWERGDSPARWRPSIHMPRWASRITLEVTAVRVERLQAISEEDAKAEGVTEGVVAEGHNFYPRRFGAPGVPCVNAYGVKSEGEHFHRKAVDAFHSLWEHINGPESWAANPWVWVVEFKRVTP